MIKRFDIVTTYIAFVQTAKQGKVRPVLVTRSVDRGKYLRIILITSKYKQKSPKYRKQRYPIKQWKLCGLKKPSYIDIVKHGTLVRSDFHIKKIGHLTRKDIIGLFKFITNYKG